MFSSVSIGVYILDKLKCKVVSLRSTLVHSSFFISLVNSNPILRPFTCEYDDPLTYKKSERPLFQPSYIVFRILKDTENWDSKMKVLK